MVSPPGTAEGAWRELQGAPHPPRLGWPSRPVHRLVAVVNIGKCLGEASRSRSPRVDTGPLSWGTVRLGGFLGPGQLIGSDLEGCREAPDGLAEWGHLPGFDAMNGQLVKPCELSELLLREIPLQAERAYPPPESLGHVPNVARKLT